MGSEFVQTKLQTAKSLAPTTVLVLRRTSVLVSTDSGAARGGHGCTCLFIAALRSRCGHYIFALSFLLSSSFFPRLISAVANWMSTIRCGLSANLGCRSETCCTRIAENTGRKNSPSAHHRTTLSGCVFATKACIDNRKKLLNSITSSTCPHTMVNFGPLAAEIGSGVWAPCKFQRFRVLVSQTLRR